MDFVERPPGLASSTASTKSMSPMKPASTDPESFAYGRGRAILRRVRSVPGDELPKVRRKTC